MFSTQEVSSETLSCSPPINLRRPIRKNGNTEMIIFFLVTFSLTFAVFWTWILKNEALGAI
jgi:hypothetical protein